MRSVWIAWRPFQEAGQSTVTLDSMSTAAAGAGGAAVSPMSFGTTMPTKELQHGCVAPEG